MKLLDETRNCVVADPLKMAGNFFERLVGLLGTRSFSAGDGLCIPLCNGIHTFGMAFPIDVIFIDPKNRAVRICQKVVPNRAGPVEMRAVCVVELPIGTLERLHIREGDTFKFCD